MLCSLSFYTVKKNILRVSREVQVGLLADASEEKNFHIQDRDSVLSSSESSDTQQIMTKDVQSLIDTHWIHHKFTKLRLLNQVFQAEDPKSMVGTPGTHINYTRLPE